MWKMVCDKERWCVTKLCVKERLWQSCLWKMVRVKVVCEKRVCVTKLCVTKAWNDELIGAHIRHSYAPFCVSRTAIVNCDARDFFSHVGSKRSGRYLAATRATCKESGLPKHRQNIEQLWQQRKWCTKTSAPGLHVARRLQHLGPAPDSKAKPSKTDN